MAKKIRAPFRVGAENKTLNNEFISKNIVAISDLVWQGLKYTMEEMKSAAPYGDGSPTNKMLRNYYLSEVLEQGFYNFYRLVDYNHKDALILKENAMKIWKEHPKESISDVNSILLAENMFLANATIAMAKDK